VPRKRKPENLGLPLRCCIRRNAYYYQVPKGQEHKWDGRVLFPLGKTLPEMYRTLAERIEITKNAKIIADILDRYAMEVTPKKSLGSQRNEALYTRKLRKVFGEMAITDILPMHIYQYYDKSPAKVSAKREIALLRHAYTKAVEWGYLHRHPFKKEVILPGEKPRNRYVNDWEIKAALELEPDTNDRGGIAIVQAYIMIKLLIAVRKSDLLRIKTTDLKEDGIHLYISKTKECVIFEWTDELREAVDYAISVRPVDISPWLLCTKEGKCFVNEKGTSSGWRSLWDRFMKLLKEKTEVTEHFTDHDIRAKVSSDQSSDEEGQKLLRHSNVALTRKVYRRKPTTVTPAQWAKE